MYLPCIVRSSEGTPNLSLNSITSSVEYYNHYHFEQSCRFVGTFTPFFAIAPKKPMSMSEEKYKKTNRGPFEKLLNPADAL